MLGSFRNPPGYTQNNVWPNFWASCSLTKLTHKVNHHGRTGSCAPNVVHLGLEAPKWPHLHLWGLAAVGSPPSGPTHMATLSRRMIGLLSLEAELLEKKRKLKDLLSRSSEFLKPHSTAFCGSKQVTGQPRFKEEGTKRLRPWAWQEWQACPEWGTVSLHIVSPLVPRVRILLACIPDPRVQSVQITIISSWTTATAPSFLPRP